MEIIAIVIISLGTWPAVDGYSCYGHLRVMNLDRYVGCFRGSGHIFFLFFFVEISTSLLYVCIFRILDGVARSCTAAVRLISWMRFIADFFVRLRRQCNVTFRSKPQRIVTVFGNAARIIRDRACRENTTNIVNRREPLFSNDRDERPILGLKKTRRPPNPSGVARYIWKIRYCMSTPKIATNIGAHI